MKMAYYPGCSSLGTSADYEKSTRAVCSALGVELVEIKNWNCCGSTPAHAVSTELSAALSARNLHLAAREGAETLLTPCPSCLSNLRHAAHNMEDPEFRASVNELMDEPCVEKFPESTSVMQALVDNIGLDGIARRAGMKLEGLRLAPYYGCLMSRPPEVMKFGDPENPTMMEDILRALGADVIDFPVKTECCGASFGIPERDMTARLSGRILQFAKNFKADALVVACPLCQMNLDLRQRQAEKAVGETFNMPVLYFTQVMGMAMGRKPAELGLEKLCVSAAPLFEKLEKTRRDNLEKARQEELEKAGREKLKQEKAAEAKS